MLAVFESKDAGNDLELVGFRVTVKMRAPLTKHSSSQHELPGSGWRAMIGGLDCVLSTLGVPSYYNKVTFLERKTPSLPTPQGFFCFCLLFFEDACVDVRLLLCGHIVFRFESNHLLVF